MRLIFGCILLAIVHSTEKCGAEDEPAPIKEFVTDALLKRNDGLPPVSKLARMGIRLLPLPVQGIAEIALQTAEWLYSKHQEVNAHGAEVEVLSNRYQRIGNYFLSVKEASVNRSVIAPILLEFAACTDDVVEIVLGFTHAGALKRWLSSGGLHHDLDAAHLKLDGILKEFSVAVEVENFLTSANALKVGSHNSKALSRAVLQMSTGQEKLDSQFTRIATELESIKKTVNDNFLLLSIQEKDVREKNARLLKGVISEIYRGNAVVDTQFKKVHESLADVKQLINKAVLLQEFSIFGDDPRVVFDLAVAYLLEGEPDRALVFLEKAIQAGSTEAHFLLGKLLLNGSPGSHALSADKGKAFSNFLEAAKQGHVGAQRWVASCYKYGVGVAISEEDAVRWFRTAADNGCEKSKTLLQLHKAALAEQCYLNIFQTLRKVMVDTRLNCSAQVPPSVGRTRSFLVLEHAVNLTGNTPLDEDRLNKIGQIALQNELSNLTAKNKELERRVRQLEEALRHENTRIQGCDRRVRELELKDQVRELELKDRFMVSGSGDESLIVCQKRTSDQETGGPLRQGQLGGLLSLRPVCGVWL